MKNILTVSILIALSAFTFLSCAEDDSETPVATCSDGIQNQDETGIDCGGVCNSCDENATLEGVLTENKTLTNDKIWKLKGRVVVEDGVELTIESGTIIKAHPGTGSEASTLIIARGAKLFAQGTADAPIIMTAMSDNIELGASQGTNLSENDRGLWGGLLILGKAPGSFDGDVTEVQIEGIPATDTNGLYGGTDATDNSGIITYVSIRHGGAEIGEGNEINGLTLGAVGNGTEINHIEVVANVDDGIEFFGGTVNADNLLVWACGDDGLDIDQAYKGTINDSMVILGDASDHGLEVDGPEGSAIGSFTLSNITLIGNSVTSNGEYADFRSHAMGHVHNIYAKSFKADSDIELDNDGVATNYNNGDLVFGTWQIVLPAGVTDVTSLFVNKAETVTVTDFGSTAVAVTEGMETVGANIAEFAWTYAHANAAY